MSLNPSKPRWHFSWRAAAKSDRLPPSFEMSLIRRILFLLRRSPILCRRSGPVPDLGKNEIASRTRPQLRQLSRNGFQSRVPRQNQPLAAYRAHQISTSFISHITSSKLEVRRTIPKWSSIAQTRNILHHQGFRSKCSRKAQHFANQSFRTSRFLLAPFRLRSVENPWHGGQPARRSSSPRRSQCSPKAYG